jgi:hypothetical protein
LYFCTYSRGDAVAPAANRQAAPVEDACVVRMRARAMQQGLCAVKINTMSYL